MAKNKDPSVTSVRLQRDPWLEALITYSKRPPSKCFLCCKEGNFSSSSKWALFLTLLKGTGDRDRDPSSPPTSSGEPLAACPSCVALMRNVWDLEDRLEEWNLLFDSALKKVYKMGLITPKPTTECRGNTYAAVEIKVEDDDSEMEESCFIPEIGFEDICDVDVDNLLEEEETRGDNNDHTSSSRRSTRKRKVDFSDGEDDCDEDISQQDNHDGNGSDNNVIERYQWDEESDGYCSPSDDSSSDPDFSDTGKTNEGNCAFSCAKCGRRFTRKRRKVSHEVFVCKIKYSQEKVKKNDVILFKCPDCEYVTSEGPDLIKHYPKHKAVNDFFACAKCDSAFPSESELWGHHQAKKHSGCKKNQKVVKGLLKQSRKPLSEILRLIGPDTILSNSCTRKAILKDEGGDQDHGDEDNSLSPRKSPSIAHGGKACCKCGKTFEMKARRVRHEIFTCGVKWDKDALGPLSYVVLSCDQCNQIFPQKHVLLSHYFTHTGIKPYGCSLCSATFLRSESLKTHGIRTGHAQAYRRDILSQESLNAPKLPFDLTEGRGPSMKRIREKPLSTVIGGLDTDGTACSVCGKDFPRLSYRVRHEIYTCGVIWSEEILETLKLKYLINKCDQCGETFAEKHNLLYHYASHTGIKPFGCEDCGDTFGRMEALRTHSARKRHFKGYKRNILSQETLDAPKILIDLRADDHDNDHDPSFGGQDDSDFSKGSSLKGGICHVCGKELKSKLEAHIRRAHYEGKWPHPCPHCPKGFVLLRNLNQHIEGAHPLGEDGLPLPLPPKNKMGRPKGKFCCSKCTCSFLVEKELRNHEKTHEDRSVSCSKCGKSYAYPHLLRTHEKKQPNCDVIPYPEKVHRFIPFEKACPFCGEVVKTRKLYQKHLRQNHEDEEKLEEELEGSKGPSLQRREREQDNIQL